MKSDTPTTCKVKRIKLYSAISKPYALPILRNKRLKTSLSFRELVTFISKLKSGKMPRSCS